MEKEELLFIVLSILFGLAVSIIGPYLVVYFLNSGLNFSLIGVLLSSGYLIQALSEWPSGVFADAYGRHISAIVGFGLCGSSLSLIAFAKGFPSLLMLYILQGVGSAFLTDTLEAWIVDFLKSKGRDDRVKVLFGKVQVINPLMSILAGITGSFISIYGIHLPLLASGLALLIACVLAMLGMREPYTILKQDRRNPLKEVLTQSLRYAQNNVVFICYSFGHVLFFASFSFFVVAWQPLIINLGLPQTMLGIVYSALMVFWSIGGFLSILTKKANHGLVVTISLLIWAFSFIGIGISNNIILTLAFMLLFEVILAVLRPQLAYWRSIIIPSEIRAAMLSFISTVVSLSMALFNIAFGVSLDRVGPFSSFITFSALSFLSCISFYLCFLKSKLQNCKYKGSIVYKFYRY